MAQFSFKGFMSIPLSEGWLGWHKWPGAASIDAAQPHPFSKCPTGICWATLEKISTDLCKNDHTPSKPTGRTKKNTKDGSSRCFEPRQQGIPSPPPSHRISWAVRALFKVLWRNSPILGASEKFRSAKGVVLTNQFACLKSASAPRKV